MNDHGTALPKIVPRTEWDEARKAMRKKEEEFGRKREALIAGWRNLPMLEMDEHHVFEGPNGKVCLADLFEGRRQLLVYHFWFQPGEEPCDGCSLWTGDLGDLGGDFANLHNYDTSLAFVSRAPPAEIDAVRKRRGWTMPWYSMVGEDFHDATGYNGWAQISVFIREGATTFLTNVVAFDDLATIGNHWTLLERAPLGLNEG